MQKIKMFEIATSRGTLYGAEGKEGLIALALPRDKKDHFDKIMAKRAHGAEVASVPPEKTRAGRQLLKYLAGKKVKLDAPVDFSGLPAFTTRVLKACHQIPPGQTLSYGELAQKAGNAQAARAVGQVMHNNPVPLFIPCHRVVGSDGSLTGFGGGLDMKEALLDMEIQGKGDML